MEKIVIPQNQIAEKLRDEILNCYEQAIKNHGTFRLGVSGGSMYKFLNTTISSVNENCLKKWKIFFCDERYVPDDDADSTYGIYKKHYPRLEKQMIPINYDLPLDDCAKDYEDKIVKCFAVQNGGIPEFDLLLLGMGEDGHTCSLFPGHHLLQETKRLVAPIDDSPKPPPRRVTMTYPLINNARQAIFLITGSGKADVIKQAFVDGESFPAGLVKTKILKGIFDDAAGQKL